MTRLQNKVAIVTGAASGIGMATTKLFLEMGCKVLCSDVNDDFLKELENELSSYKKESLIIKSDVTKRQECIDIAKLASYKDIRKCRSDFEVKSSLMLPKILWLKNNPGLR